MLIAVDFDGVLGARPALWRDVIARMLQDGCRVVVVTLRHPERCDVVQAALEHLAERVPVIGTDGAPKLSTTQQAGLAVDVWIDDRPECISDGADPVRRRNRPRNRPPAG